MTLFYSFLLSKSQTGFTNSINLLETSRECSKDFSQAITPLLTHWNFYPLCCKFSCLFWLPSPLLFSICPYKIFPVLDRKNGPRRFFKIRSRIIGNMLLIFFVINCKNQLKIVNNVVFVKLKRNFSQVPGFTKPI